MSLSLDDVKRVANLARIEIGEDEARTALTQLSGIFGLIEQMQSGHIRHQADVPRPGCDAAAAR